jgi:hypothetical protein
VKTLRLRCPCGRNIADITQQPGEVASPRGYNGFTYAGLSVTPRAEPPDPAYHLRVYHHAETGPDITWARRCLCGHDLTFTGRRVADLWQANADNPALVVYHILHD